MNRLDSRTLANRENAKKSTGPRTAEGKARSRANAFQHGLAGEGVAWPGEEGGEMARFVAEQVAAEPIAPRDAREHYLVDRIARVAWQIDRGERSEEVHAAIRASEAEGVEEERREEQVERLVAIIETDPGRAVRGLLRSKLGCGWIIDSLRELIDAVDADWWLSSLDLRLDALCAPAQPGRLRISRAKALALALGSAEYGAIWPNGVPGLEHLESDPSPEAFREWSRRRAEVVREAKPKWRADLKAILERRLAEVERRLEELDARPDPGMEFAGLAAAFDVSEGPERIRRYLRSKDRERRRLLDELERHRVRRDANPIETAQAAEPVAEAAPEPPPPLTPFEPPPDAARNDEGYGLNTPHVTARWVRSVDSDGEGDRVGSGDVEPEVKPRH